MVRKKYAKELTDVKLTGKRRAGAIENAGWANSADAAADWRAAGLARTR